MKFAVAAVLFGFIVATLSMCGCSVPVESAAPAPLLRRTDVVVDASLPDAYVAAVFAAVDAWDAASPRARLRVVLLDRDVAWRAPAAHEIHVRGSQTGACPIDGYTLTADNAAFAAEGIVCLNVEVMAAHHDRLLSVVAHELGHILGLGDSHVDGEVMYGCDDPRHQALTPSGGDAAKLTALQVNDGES